MKLEMCECMFCGKYYVYNTDTGHIQYNDEYYCSYKCDVGYNMSLSLYPIYTKIIISYKDRRFEV